MKSRRVQRHDVLRVGVVGTAILVSFVSLVLLRQESTPTGPNLSICSSEAGATEESTRQVVKRSLSNNVTKYQPKEAMAIVINAETGAVLGSVILDKQANYEGKTSVDTPYEPGSVMKPLIIAAALDAGAISTGYRYFDNDKVLIEERVIVNASIYEPSERSLQEIVSLSLNTGAVQLMKELGKGGNSTTIDDVDRETWHKYLTERYYFGESFQPGLKGLERGYVPSPNVTNASFVYAQTSFGLGLTVSPLEMTAAYASLVNGGNYITPYICSNEENLAPRKSVTKSVSQQMVQILSRALQENNDLVVDERFTVGGKSGTAPIATNNGTYKADVNNGTYIGFVKNKQTYIVFVRLTDPKYAGYASRAAMLAWNDIVVMLIEDNLLQ